MIAKTILQKVGSAFVILLILYFVNPFGYNVYLIYLMPLLLLFNKNKSQKKVDTDAFILFLFSITYAIFFALNATSGKQYILIYAITPITFYLLGKAVIKKLDSNEDLIFCVFLVLGILNSFSAILSVFSIFLEEGFISIERNLPSIWNGEIIIATIMGSYFTINMCIPSLLIVGHKRLNILVSLVVITIFIVSVICVLKIGSRTQLGIFIITSLISLIYIFQKQSPKKNFITIFLLGITVYLLINQLSFSLQEDWLSAFAGRMEEGGADDISSGGGRLDRWSKSIENLFKKPLGWPLEDFGHAHNLWLDVLRIGGFIPFVFLILFTIKNIVSLRILTKRASEEYRLVNQILVYFISLYLLFMLEPILEGMLQTFALYCFFAGSLKAYLASQHEKGYS